MEKFSRVLKTLVEFWANLPYKDAHKSIKKLRKLKIMFFFSLIITLVKLFIFSSRISSIDLS